MPNRYSRFNYGDFDKPAWVREVEQQEMARQHNRKSAQGVFAETVLADARESAAACLAQLEGK
jgi:hypothetical protein